MKIKYKNKANCRIKYGYGEKIVISGYNMRVGRSPHKLKIPRFFNCDLAYLSGYHLGDGYLEDFEKTFIRIGKGGYEIDYADKDKFQLELINRIIYQQFNYRLRVFAHNTKKQYIARGKSKVYHWFLNQVLKIPYGKRTDFKIPRWVYKDKSFIKNFLSGFFDAEGDVSRTINRRYKDKIYYILRIQITQKNSVILAEIQSVLKKYFSIHSYIHKKWNQDAYILRIRSNTGVIQFFKSINSRNVTKREKLLNLLKS
tara:strand:- start:9831 stop:10598 length:768 start_codon:yes stop_codon:yes gene_type:complete